MSKNPNQKLKLLYLYQILLQRTDENHKLTTDELRAALERCGSSLRLFPADNEHFYLDVDVVVSPQFFSWVFSLEGDVRIVDPPEVCEAFEKQIHKFID